MATPEPCKYRAFLSYSHRDAAAVKRLHGRLEGFRIDKDLVGRETPMGPIPKHLRPIFRDRHDFDAGGTLAAQTVAALDSSAALILRRRKQQTRQRGNPSLFVSPSGSPANSGDRRWRSRRRRERLFSAGIASGKRE
jgi:hypothetical protein